jgi:hypothetical protein
VEPKTQDTVATRNSIDKRQDMIVAERPNDPRRRMARRLHQQEA